MVMAASVDGLPTEYRRAAFDRQLPAAAQERRPPFQPECAEFAPAVRQADVEIAADLLPFLDFLEHELDGFEWRRLAVGNPVGDALAPVAAVQLLAFVRQ